MSFQKVATLFLVFVISLAILSQVKVEAARALPEDFAGAAHLETYSSVYEKAKNTMACWLGRLASGPSPKGPGH
uniref:Transmembrane protein n=1 Tax=Rhizophora mucronata TaxID=61149 RepID=A0A2P2J3U6_RHIMU